MLGFHSQNVPLSGFKLNHIYIKNKGTQKYTDLGELKGGTSSALSNALRVYIPGYGYAQERQDIQFRFVGKPKNIYNFYADMAISFSNTPPTYTCFDAGLNQEPIKPMDMLNALTNKEGFCDFSIGIPSPSSYRTCKVQISVIEYGSMTELGDFYLGDESRWLIYEAINPTAYPITWKEPIPVWDDILSIVPNVSLKIPIGSQRLYSITPPIYAEFDRDGLQARAGTISNPSNLKWRGGSDPNIYRQIDQGSLLTLYETNWPPSMDGYQLDITKKGISTLNVTLEIPGVHPIAYVEGID